jgi:hypothetical protein
MLANHKRPKLLVGHRIDARKRTEDTRTGLREFETVIASLRFHR